MLYNVFLFDNRFDLNGQTHKLVVHVFKQAKNAKKLGSYKGRQVDVIADVVQVREALVELKMYVLRMPQVLQDYAQTAADIFRYAVVTD